MSSRIAEEIETPGPRSTHARPGVWLADVALVLMSVIWGVNYSVVKYGTSVLSPLAYNDVRITLATIALLVVAWIWGGTPPSRRDVFALLALGALGNGVYQIFFVEGVAHTRAGEAALVVGASPALMALFGRMLGVEQISRRGIVGVALSMFGVALIVLGRAASADPLHGGSLKGDLLVLVGAVCWAIYTVILTPFTRRINGWWLSAITILGGCLVLTVAGFGDVLAMQWASVPRAAWAAILYSGLGALVIAYMFWYYGVRVMGATRTAMYGNLQPLIALLVAWLTLGEVPSLSQWVGATTIVSGVLLTRSTAVEGS
ncbi:MAG TPA: DMT family transporter [Gemmatimonadaceae bacterium]|nr:DMT family transporter [Gemmatimonadaceae bacterium]